MRKILVIEDEQDIRENIIELLSEEGYEAISAQDGEEGIRKIWEELPDLIICDILMPSVDGYAVLNVMTKNATTASIPFIFLTAKSQRSDLRKGMTLGADDYITKPFTRLELLMAVETRLLKQDLLVSQAQKKLAELRTNISRSLPHELLGPLSVILGQSEQMLQRLQTTDDHDAIIENIGDIHDAAQKLLHSIQRYLLYADLELILADADQLARARSARVNSVKEGIEEIAQALALNHGRENDLALDLEDSPIQISEVYLQKIIEELLDNALKYSPKGSQVQISGRLMPVKNQYQFIIRNHGPGMTAEQIANVGGYIRFDRKGYERSGLGMGLEIVKELAEIHGGTTSIQSQPGQVTSVEVVLPV